MRTEISEPGSPVLIRVIRGQLTVYFGWVRDTFSGQDRNNVTVYRSPADIRNTKPVAPQASCLHATRQIRPDICGTYALRDRVRSIMAQRSIIPCTNTTGGRVSIMTKRLQRLVRYCRRFGVISAVGWG